MKFTVTFEVPDGASVSVNGLAAAPAPVHPTGAVPPCPKHGPDKVRESKFGGVYCSAQDDSEEKGYCSWKQK